MEKETRKIIETLTRRARALLEQEFREQLEGHFDILLSGRIPVAAGSHLSPADRILWDKIVSAIVHTKSQGKDTADAVVSYVREAAFVWLNRLVALKMLESRELVPECVSRYPNSSGFKRFTQLAPGLSEISDGGYRLFFESIFDEVSSEIGFLFDRHNPATLVWPRRPCFETLLEWLNSPDIPPAVFGKATDGDETIGWVFQYFNGEDERQWMRAESSAPRTSRELAVRNQFFTPRYVVRFLTDNTLGRLWSEMCGGQSAPFGLDYWVEGIDPKARAPKDPRDIKVLDPACGSGHFLLYAFDLFAGDVATGRPGFYEQAWKQDHTPPFSETGRTLRQDYPDLPSLHRTTAALILRHNLFGVDIDARAVQIAALALYLRAQRAYADMGISAQERVPVLEIHTITAEPMGGESATRHGFAATLKPPLVGELFLRIADEMHLAAELGTLLRPEKALKKAIATAREQFLREVPKQQLFLVGMATPSPKAGPYDLSGISDASFFDSVEHKILQSLSDYAEGTSNVSQTRRRLFAADAAQSILFVDLCRKKFDVVLMNPPFGAASLAAKKEFDSAYPRTKNDIFAAFVERGIELLEPGGYLGAITSRTGFFLSSFYKWRQEILMKEAPLFVLADLGGGVLDSAMVEVAAYCLRKEKSS